MLPRYPAILVQGSTLLAENKSRVVALAAQYRLPAFYNLWSFVEIDGLAFYGQIGREGFELIRTHDLEGTVAKRLDDPPRLRWLKIKKPDYSKEGGGDLFMGHGNGPRIR